MYACCKWLDFISDVRRLWQPEWGRFNHVRARNAWGVYAATPCEFIARERIDLDDERAAYECPFCGKDLPDERAACCGEVGHGIPHGESHVRP